MRRLAALAVLSTACAGTVDPLAAASLPEPTGAAPTAVQLRTSPLVEGTTATFEARLQGGTRQTWFVVGRPGPPTCPAALGGSCVSMADPTVAGSALPVGGVATTTWPVAGTGPVVVQAVVLAGAAPAVVSNARIEPVLPRDGDFDQDGLSNLDERVAGSDPRLADSDGGGVWDGQEVAVDGTDPGDASDDVGVERACGNGVDDDGDGRVDARDADCAGAAPEADCASGIDDDGDGLVDCADPDCRPSPDCPETDCADGIDEDDDHLVDCEDPDCDAVCVEQDCDDGLDDDSDGDADCADEDCWSRRCFDSSLAWVTSGHGTIRNSMDFRQLAGGMWVAGASSSAVCAWTSWGLGPQVDPACRLDGTALPVLADLVLDPGVGFRAGSRNGPLWFGPVTGSTTYTSSSGRRSTTVWFDALRPGEPAGSCAQGAPTAFYVDLDGDGYAVGPTGDHMGRHPSLVYTCGTAPPGATALLGDCSEDDPTWHPGTVTLAVGRACADAHPWDRDADGRWAAAWGGPDADDNDGGVP
jgi:hypothetical protein